MLHLKSRRYLHVEIDPSGQGFTEAIRMIQGQPFTLRLSPAQSRKIRSYFLPLMDCQKRIGKAEGEGRFALAHRCWTDAIGCAYVDGKPVCEDGTWLHRYGGTFRKADSIVTFAYRYEGTTPPAKCLPPEDHSGEASFRLQRADWDSLLVLQRADTGTGPWRFNMELLKVR